MRTNNDEAGRGWTGARWRAPQDDVRGRVLPFKTQAIRVRPKEVDEAMQSNEAQRPPLNVLPDVDPRPLVTVDGVPVEGTEEETQGGFVWPDAPPFDPEQPDTERESGEPQPYDRSHVSDEIDPLELAEARRRWNALRFGLE